MAGAGEPRTVTLDPEAAKRADEALAAELDRLVAERISKETKHTMDAAQMQAAIQAADKRAADAESRASAAETAAKKAADAAGAAADAVTKLTVQLQARADAEKQAADEKAKADAAVTLERAGHLARARGFHGDAAKAEASRLASLGRAAVDELLMATPAPAADPMGVHLRGAPAAQEERKATVHAYEDPISGRPVYTITDPALTTPGKHGGVAPGAPAQMPGVRQ